MEKIMKKIFIMTGILTALTTMLSHGADYERRCQEGTSPDIMIRFKDKPGSYFIKIEAVKDVSKDGTYTSISKQEQTYKQSQEYSYTDELTVPYDATHIRISIRKIKDGKISSVGKYTFIDAHELRKGAIRNTCKKALFGIQMINSFDKKGKDLAYTLRSDSHYIF